MIRVKFSHGLYMIWNANDAVEIREKYRIIGSLIGTSPIHPRQNDSHGLPLILSDEEVRTLHSIGVIEIIEQSFPAKLNDPKLLSYYNDSLRNFRKESRQKFIEERREQIISNLDKIVTGKLKKNKLQIEGSDLEEYRQKILDEMLSNIREPTDKDLEDRVRFHIQSQYQQFKMEQTIQLPLLEPYGLERLKYLTFQHFWSRGYYLTNGLKFGAHFLVYDHDPILFHAKFIVYCCPNTDDFERFKQRMIQAYGRLGKNVRKNVIIVHYEQPMNSGGGGDDDEKIQLEHVHWNPMLFTEEQQHHDANSNDIQS